MIRPEVQQQDKSHKKLNSVEHQQRIAQELFMNVMDETSGGSLNERQKIVKQVLLLLCLKKNQQKSRFLSYFFRILDKRLLEIQKNRKNIEEQNLAQNREHVKFLKDLFRAVSIQNNVSKWLQIYFSKVNDDKYKLKKILLIIALDQIFRKQNQFNILKLIIEQASQPFTLLKEKDEKIKKAEKTFFRLNERKLRYN